jgi:lysophospholipid acyltransferase (LPLAT)-like uncharacterized protein
MSKILLSGISVLLYTIARMLHMSYRYRFSGNIILQDLKKNNQNFIFSIYHQNLLAGILAQTGYTHVVIVSQSKDAEGVAYTCQKLGHKVVRGSSKKGNIDKNGKVAKEGMIESLKAGCPGAVTVDGPKGPAFKAKPGIIDMAIKSGCVIVPYIVQPESYWEFKSWDKFRLAKPFSKIFVSYDRPIFIKNENPDFEVELANLDMRMHAATEVLSEQRKVNKESFSLKNWWQ